MILTPVSHADLPGRLARFGMLLSGDPLAERAFGLIAGSIDRVEGDSLDLSRDPDHHAQAVWLCRSFGLGITDGSPVDGFSWDGRSVRIACEPSVLVHEVAHWQCCAPERRAIPDFGLGAGPETGLRDAAESAACLFGADRDREEALASLLGILWEASLGQPAVLAFLDQNWLEGDDTRHFRRVLGHLFRLGLIDSDARPTRGLRRQSDPGPIADW